eukprot:994899-Lingulodinium_polyedra.AAC.1
MSRACHDAGPATMDAAQAEDAAQDPGAASPVAVKEEPASPSSVDPGAKGAASPEPTSTADESL